MEKDQDGRLARRVAEAADAWLRDPLDTGVYQRLVDATLAWRTGTEAPPGPGAGPGSLGGPGPSLVVDGEVLASPRPDTGDARFLRPERAPRPVGSALGDVASLLRARAAAARAHETDDGSPASAPTADGTVGRVSDDS